MLAALTYLLLLAANALFGALGRRGTTAPALLREVRASFYRKLFLAFVAAVFVPVVLLAVVTRNFVADEMRANVEAEARADRVGGQPRRRGPGRRTRARTGRRASTTT